MTAICYCQVLQNEVVTSRTPPGNICEDYSTGYPVTLVLSRGLFASDDTYIFSLEDPGLAGVLGKATA
jgi:hypothetical protein